MTIWTGKRTERMRIPVQVNVDPEMSQEIRLRASRKMRPIGSEIVRLIAIGLSHDDEQTVYEHFRTFAHKMSLPLTLTHISAPGPRKAETQKAKAVSA